MTQNTPYIAKNPQNKQTLPIAAPYHIKTLKLNRDFSDSSRLSLQTNNKLKRKSYKSILTSVRKPTLGHNESSTRLTLLNHNPLTVCSAIWFCLIFQSLRFVFEISALTVPFCSLCTSHLISCYYQFCQVLLTIVYFVLVLFPFFQPTVRIFILLFYSDSYTATFCQQTGLKMD